MRLCSSTAVLLSWNRAGAVISGIYVLRLSCSKVLMPRDLGASACAFRFHQGSWLELEREFEHCEAFFVEALEDRLLFHDSLRLVVTAGMERILPHG